MYITFTDYQSLGGAVITDGAAFPRYECKARIKLNYYTQNRIVNITPVPEDIQQLMVELIDMLYQTDTGDKVQSFSNEGVSVSFAATTSTTDEVMLQLIREYASDYCWRGVDR